MRRHSACCHRCAQVDGCWADAQAPRPVATCRRLRPLGCFRVLLSLPRGSAMCACVMLILLWASDMDWGSRCKDGMGTPASRRRSGGEHAARCGGAGGGSATWRVRHGARQSSCWPRSRLQHRLLPRAARASLPNRDAVARHAVASALACGDRAAGPVRGPSARDPRGGDVHTRAGRPEARGDPAVHPLEASLGCFYSLRP